MQAGRRLRRECRRSHDGRGRRGVGANDLPVLGRQQGYAERRSGHALTTGAERERKDDVLDQTRRIRGIGKRRQIEGQQHDLVAIAFDQQLAAVDCIGRAVLDQRRRVNDGQRIRNEAGCRGTQSDRTAGRAIRQGGELKPQFRLARCQCALHVGWRAGPGIHQVVTAPGHGPVGENVGIGGNRLGDGTGQEVDAADIFQGTGPDRIGRGSAHHEITKSVSIQIADRCGRERPETIELLQSHNHPIGRGERSTSIGRRQVDRNPSGLIDLHGRLDGPLVPEGARRFAHHQVDAPVAVEVAGRDLRHVVHEQGIVHRRNGPADDQAGIVQGEARRPIAVVHQDRRSVRRGLTAAEGEIGISVPVDVAQRENAA